VQLLNAQSLYKRHTAANYYPLIAGFCKSHLCGDERVVVSPELPFIIKTKHFCNV